MLLYIRTGSVVVCALETNHAITTSSNEMRNANSAPATIDGTSCGNTTRKNRVCGSPHHRGGELDRGVELADARARP